MKISFISKIPANAKILAAILAEGAALPPGVKALDEVQDGRISQAIKAAKFTGKRDQISGKLQQHYGYAKEQAEKELDEFAKALR